MNDITRFTSEAVDSAANDVRFKDAVLRCCDSDRSLPSERFETNLHAQDQMFLHSLREHQSIDAALSQYFNVALQQYRCVDQITQSLFGASHRQIEFFDFACGYGRLLRFLVLSHEHRRIHASDIQPEAIDYVSKTFGIDAFASNADPDLFECDRRFDFIWVASLFTHLPQTLFDRWLAKLYSLLTPRGVLCFSVRDSSQLQARRTMPNCGFLYETQSENFDLSSDIYGTTYASEHFVKRAIEALTDTVQPVHRLARALANEQDLYLVSKGLHRNFDCLQNFRRGEWGWVDRRVLSRDGELYLEGWAASLDEGPAECVRITVDGKVYSVKPTIQRPDVVEAFSDAHLAQSGWSIRHQFEVAPPTAFVEVVAGNSDRTTALLFAGYIPVSQT